MRKLEVTDVGPVERIEIPIPDAGGLVVLRGANGSGKSLCLQAVGAAIGQGGKPVSRDGSPGALVSGLGVRLSVGRRASRSGQLEVSHLEGNDPALFVDPGILNPDSADAERIRALLRMSGAEVDICQFAELVGGDEELRAICRETSLESGQDVPAMAGAIKRDIEAAARKMESEATNLSQRADGELRALKELVDGPEGVEVPEIGHARDQHERAVRNLARAEGAQKSAAQLIESAAQASIALGQLGEAGTSDAIESAEFMVKAGEVGLDEARKELEKAQAALHRAQAAVQSETRDLDRARQDLESQKRSASQRESLGKAIEAARGARQIDIKDLEELRKTVDDSAGLVALAEIRERTNGQRAEAERVREKARVAYARAQELRSAAAATERVLMDAVSKVAGDGLEMRSGRLMVRTSDRGLVPFAELSEGQRWRRALEIAAASVGRNGLLVIGQTGYEGLDPERRSEIAQIARELGVVILTAESDSGSIRAEIQS